MIKAVLLASILLLASGLVTVTQTYPNGAGSFIDIGGFTFTFPCYPVAIASGDSVEIVVRLPKPAPGVDLSILSIFLAAANFAPVQAVPTFAAGLTVGSVTVTAGGAFPYVMVYGATTSFSAFELDVRINGVSKIKIADMIRMVPTHYIYLKAPSTIDVSVTGVDPANVGDPVSVNVQEYSGTNVYQPPLLTPATSTLSATGSYSVTTP